MRIPEAVFFYADNCPKCGPTLARLAPWFAEIGRALLVRKPTAAEAATPSFAYPSLLLPVGFGAVARSTLLVGDKLPEAAIALYGRRT